MHSLKSFQEALVLGLAAGILEERHEVDEEPYLRAITFHVMETADCLIQLKLPWVRVLHAFPAMRDRPEMDQLPTCGEKAAAFVGMGKVIQL